MTVVGAFDTVELVDYMDTHGTSKKGYLPFVGLISCGVAGHFKSVIFWYTM